MQFVANFSQDGDTLPRNLDQCPVIEFRLRSSKLCRRHICCAPSTCLSPLPQQLLDSTPAQYLISTRGPRGIPNAIQPSFNMSGDRIEITAAQVLLHSTDSSPLVSKKILSRTIDVSLLLMLALLLTTLATHVQQLTRNESARITDILTEDGISLSRRTRPTTIAKTTAQETMPAPSAELFSPLSEVSSATRQLLESNEEVFSTPENPGGNSPHFLPFSSVAVRDAFYKKWYARYLVLEKELTGGPRTFRHMLGPAVNQLNISTVPLGSTKYCIAGFDSRTLPEFIFTLKHTFHMLTGRGYGQDGEKDGKVIYSSPELRASVHDWAMILFVTPSAEPWFIKELQIGKGLPGEHIVLVRAEPIEKRQASTLAASYKFYERMDGCEHLVYIQPDAFMVRSDVLQGTIHRGPTLEAMINRYVYLGAPWNWCWQPFNAWCYGGGNGGASYRRRSAMLDMTRHIACGDWRCEWVDDYDGLGRTLLDGEGVRPSCKYTARCLLCSNCVSCVSFPCCALCAVGRGHVPDQAPLRSPGEVRSRDSCHRRRRLVEYRDWS